MQSSSTWPSRRMGIASAALRSGMAGRAIRSICPARISFCACGVLSAGMRPSSGSRFSITPSRPRSKTAIFPDFEWLRPMQNGMPGGMARIAEMMHKDAAWLEAHPQYKAYSWDFHFDETKHQDGFYYHFTQCPLNTFARKEGYLEVLPIMCDIDYKTAALMHAKLYRDHTLAGGGEVCDYWFVGDKVENPK